MVAVCVWERDTDRCMYKNWERDIVYICVCERERERKKEAAIETERIKTEREIESEKVITGN